MKLFVAVKHNNILLLILTRCQQVSVIRPSSSCPYKKFYKLVACSAYWIQCHMGSH